MVPKPVGWTRRGLLPGSDLTPLKRLLSGQWAPPRSAGDRQGGRFAGLFKRKLKSNLEPLLGEVARAGANGFEKECGDPLGGFRWASMCCSSLKIPAS